jgi:phage terminase large subunit
MGSVPAVDFMASEKQREFLVAVLEDTDSDTVVFGGARFNGKSFAVCLAAVLCCLKWPGIRVLMLRQVMKSAEANLGEEIEAIHTYLGLPSQSVTKLAVKGRYVYPNGSYIQLGYCSREDDWQVYKGLQFEFIFFEEATQFLEHMFDGLRGSNRARRPQPLLKPKKVLSTNPDGRGMGWCKKRFVDPKTRDKGVRYIGCRVRDSLPTLERDPGYVLRELRRLPEWQRRQWELGDWDAVAGQFWSMNPDVFVSCYIPEWADIHAGIDDGYWPDAYACVWFAKWTDFRTGKHRIHAFRDYKEHRLNNIQKPTETLAIEEGFDLPVKARWCDPTVVWKRKEDDSGLSTTTAHTWAQNGMVVSEAFSNTRVAGWMLQRTLMDDGVLTIDPDGCPNLYAEMTGTVHGRNSSDMDKACEDHCQDGLRYGLVSVFAGGYRRKQTPPREARREQVRRLAMGGYRG